MSTSIALVTWAEVARERRMWSAIPRRLAVIGSSCSPPAADAGAGAGCRAGDVDAVLGCDSGHDRRNEALPVLLVAVGLLHGRRRFRRRRGSGRLGAGG